MKKFLAVLLICTMFFNINVTSHAETVSSRESNEVTLTSGTARASNVLDYTGYIYPPCISGSNFTLSSKGDLYISISSTADCKVQLINNNSTLVISGSNTVRVPGDSSGHSYLLKKNCPAGTYRLKFTSSTGQIFVSYIVRG